MGQIQESGVIKCPSCKDKMAGCASFMLTHPMDTDGRFSEEDARRLSAAWNVTKQLDLETLERLHPFESADLRDEDFVKEEVDGG